MVDTDSTTWGPVFSALCMSIAAWLWFKFEVDWRENGGVASAHGSSHHHEGRYPTADQLDLQALHRVRERLVSPANGHNENRVIGGEVDVAATRDRPEHPPVLAC